MPAIDTETALIELARRLLPTDGSLVDDIRLAVREPKEFRKRYADRDLESAESIEPWSHSLVEGILERKRAGWIDWKAGVDDIISAIEVDGSPLPRDPRRWDWLDALQFESIPTLDVLRLIADRLAHEGWTLAILDTNSDSYVLVVIPSDEAQVMEALAQSAGERLLLAPY
jgi:hypothetical protein